MKDANLEQVKSYIYDFVRLRPEEQIGLHAQPTWELCYIVSGRGLRVVGDCQERFKAGEVVLIPPGMLHCWYFDGCAEDEIIEKVCMQISDDWLRSLGETLPEASEAVMHVRQLDSAVRFSPSSAAAISSLLVAMDGESELEQLSSLFRILALFLSEKEAESIGCRTACDRDEERRKRVEIYVACNFQRDITLTAVANHVGLSRTAFCRWMRQHMHTTFAAYVLRHRLQKSSELLRNAIDLPISQIAYQSGFSDISHFNRMFKREFGSSPKDWRNRL